MTFAGRMLPSSCRAHGLVKALHSFLMFNSAPRLSHICLRCQRDLARRAPRNLARPFLDGGSLRHQSAAAARPVDEVDDHDHGQETAADGANRDTQSDAVAQAKERRPLFRNFRKLKRTPTTGLEINSLGKPSEIILLPSHDRRLPESVEYEDGPKLNLSAAIESEKVPLAWEQVKEFIEKAHAGIETPSGPVSIEEWTALKVALKRGFSRSQLHRFLQEGSPTSVIPDDTGRIALAAMIATDVWGYQPPRSASSQEKQAPAAKPKETISKEVNFTNEDEVLLLRRDPVYGIAALSRLCDVTVSIRSGKVTVSGTKEEVTKAHKWLTTRKPRLKHLDIEGYGEVLFTEKKRPVVDLDQRIGTARGVVLSKHPNQDGISIRFMQANKSAVFDARRDLRLLAEPAQSPSFIAAARPERVRFAPYFVKGPTRWPTSHHQWGRAFDTVAVGATGMTRRAETSSWIDDHWQDHKQQLEHPLQRQTLNSPNAVRCEFSARLGLNLYNLDPMSKYTGLSNPKNKAWFVDEVPLLAQLLASKDFQEAPPPSASDVPVQSPFLTRLLLQPVHLESIAPSIEIYLYGQDQAAGLQQTLNVARITAIFTESCARSLSLPTLPVDISFNRQIKQDLFAHRSPSTSQHPTLLQTIGVYLANTRKASTEIPNFWSFAPLKIPAGLVDVADSPDLKKGSIEYVLSAAEEVQTHARLLPTAFGVGHENDTRLMLEHRVFQGGKWGPDREEVRLVQQPLLAAPVMKGVGLDNLQTVALDVAERFGDLGRQLRHRMQSIK